MAVNDVTPQISRNTSDLIKTSLAADGLFNAPSLAVIQLFLLNASQIHVHPPDPPDQDLAGSGHHLPSHVLPGAYY